MDETIKMKNPGHCQGFFRCLKRNIRALTNDKLI